MKSLVPIPLDIYKKVCKTMEDTPPQQRTHGDDKIQHLIYIGRLEGRMTGLEKRVDSLESEIRQQLQQILKKLEGLTEDRAAIKGGWKTLLVVAALVISLSTAATWVIDKVSVTFKNVEVHQQQ